MIMRPEGKFISLVLVALIMSLISFQGCADNEGPKRGPQEVLSSYLDDLIAGRMDEAYRNLSSDDKNTGAPRTFLSEKSDEENFIRSQLAKKVSYAVKDISVTGNRARAVVEITAPDFDKIIKDVQSRLSPEELPAGNLEAHARVCALLGGIVKKYREKGIPMKTRQELFHLIKEPEGWKIALQGSGKR